MLGGRRVAVSNRHGPFQNQLRALTFLLEENQKHLAAINGNIREMRSKLLGSIIPLPCLQIRQEALNRRPVIFIQSFSHNI